MHRNLTRDLSKGKLNRRDFLKGVGLTAGTLAFGGFSTFAQDKYITLGTLLPLTGALAGWGQPEQAATDLAKYHVNQAGGPLGKELDLVHRDSRTDPTTAVDAARKLVTISRVPAFAGANSSGVTLATARAVSIPNEVVQVAVASTSPKLTELEDNDFIFRTCPSDALQGIVLGNLAYDEGYETASTIYVNNAYGQGLSDNFKKAYEEAGGKVLATVPYEKGKPSYRAELKKATEDSPEVLMLFGYIENGSTILRQAIGGKFIEEFIVADGMAGAEEVIENVGAEHLEGVLGTTPLSPKTASLDFYRQGYEKLFGTPPPKPSFLQLAYDAIVIPSLAIHAAGKATGPAIRDHMRVVANPPGEKIDASQLARGFELLDAGKEIDYVGAGGSQDFDEHGDITTPFGIFQVQSGEWVQVKTVE